MLVLPDIQSMLVACMECGMPTASFRSLQTSNQHFLNLARNIAKLPMTHRDKENISKTLSIADLPHELRSSNID
jgi:conjugal transfer/entry exclusion protein